jgi:hypothetical protein
MEAKVAHSLVSIGGQSYAPQNVLMADVLEVAKIDKNHLESQLSRVLATITGNSVNVQALTCEERYAIFLHYLDVTRDQNDLSVSINPAEYLAENLDQFSKERQRNERGVSIRHLTGLEAEALESGCEHTEDWILGAMAITIEYGDQLPALDMQTSVEFTARMIATRIDTLLSLSTVEFNELMDQYLDLQLQQDHLVNITFDNGIVLEKIGKRGADDAPVRFRPSIAFTGYCKELLSIATRKDNAIQH